MDAILESAGDVLSFSRCHGYLLPDVPPIRILKIL